jgi:hypothetical protein
VDEANRQRRKIGCRQIRDGEQPAYRAQQPLLREIAERGACQCREQRQDEQLQYRERECESARGAERLQQRHHVQVPVHVATRRHGDRDRAQQHAHQARETQEASRAVDGVAYLRAGLGDVAQPPPGSLVGDEPGRGLDAATLAGEQLRVAHAAAGLDQLRGRQIRRIHEQARRQLREGAALVGAGDQHAADAQRGGADGEL